MEYRNSSASQHLRNGAIFNKDSSHGVEIDGGSTGGFITAVGDDANIALTVSAKGAGPTFIGGTNSPSFFGGSTAPFRGFVRFQDTAVATPNFATTNAMVMETTHVITGVNSSHFIVANGVNLSTDCSLVGCYVGSTVGDVHCRFAKVSTLTVGSATATINFLIMRF